MELSPSRLAQRFLSPAQQHRKDEVDRKKHQAGARRRFRALLGALQEPLLTEAREAAPGDVKRQKRLIGDRLGRSPEVSRFLDHYLGTDAESSTAYSWRNTGRYLLRDVILGLRGLNAALKKLDQLSGNGFQAKAMTESQEAVRSLLPEELRAFLPPNIVVDIDDDGYIERITDRFAAQYKTLGVKIGRMRMIVETYNDIVKKVKKDLRSPDETTRLAALVTAILMETGIRPGREGNKANIKIDGDSVEVETFGAITLGPSHVRFIRDNFAELQFVGKMGGVNTTSLSNSDILKVLNDYVENALKKGSKYVFVTHDGERFTYSDLSRYFRENFKGIAPTDFRKLKATEAILDSLNEEKENLYARIRKVTEEETENLRERVIQEIVETVTAAMGNAQEALSHGAASTTKDSYIDPGILLQFFSTGAPAATLRDAVLDRRTQLAFDPMTFVQMASPRAVAARFSREGAETLRDLMEALEDDLEGV